MKFNIFNRNIRIGEKEKTNNKNTLKMKQCDQQLNSNGKKSEKPNMHEENPTIVVDPQMQLCKTNE